MKCGEARRLFGAYWDDDTTQAEREGLENHFTACNACRTEYEEYSRVLEWVATLPRTEAAPNFVERTLARAHRAASAPDRVSEPRVRWVPLTAAAALLVVAAGLVSSWLDMGMAHRHERAAERLAVRQPEQVQPQLTSVRSEPDAPAQGGASPTALAADSLFDHSEDVEFILDPVTLRRGRATVSRHQPAAGNEGRPAVISF